MAATSLTTGLLPLTANGSVSDATGENIDAANGNQVPGAVPERVVLRLTSAATSGMTVTIKAGANPPYPSASQGDLVVTVPASTTKFVGPFMSARFLQADGTLRWTYSATSGTNTVAALRLPKSQG